MPVSKMMNVANDYELKRLIERIKNDFTIEATDHLEKQTAAELIKLFEKQIADLKSKRSILQINSRRISQVVSTKNQSPRNDLSKIDTRSFRTSTKDVFLPKLNP